MRRPTPAALAALALALALASYGCGGGDPPQAAQRVIGVSKQLNEFLYAIGAEYVLVGRDLTSLYPPQIQELPSVGYHRGLSAEGILSLEPTMVLTDGNVGPDGVLEQVGRVGVRVDTIDPGSSLESAQAAMRELGERFGREGAAERVIKEWDAEMRTVVATAPDSGDRPRVLLMHFGQVVNDYLAVNRGSPADRMIEWAGGVNAVDSIGGMTRLTPELIARAAPDVIIATDVGFDRVGSIEEFAALPGVSLTPAARDRRIHRIDESEIIYFGPRTPETVRRLRERIGG